MSHFFYDPSFSTFLVNVELIKLNPSQCGTNYSLEFQQFMQLVPISFHFYNDEN
jgi:hypothetical protein